MARILIAAIAFLLGAGSMLLVDLEHWRDLRYVFSPVTEFADGARYQGNKNAQGQLEGYGRMTWGNGAEYEGEFHAGLFHGKGRLVYPHLSIYEGEFAKGYIHGRGKMTYDDGSYYEGEFLSGFFHGHGKLIHADGSVYEGSFDNNKLNGTGKWIYADTSVYTGEVKDGLMHGKGEWLQADGRKYTGEFVRGRMHGQGVLVDLTGAQYSGEFTNNVFTGKGIAKSGDDTYAGEFVDWQLHGQGVHTDKEGNQWQGEFKHGMLDGQGSYQGKKGEKYTGEFNFGQYQGKGKLVSVDGDIYEGEFEYGQKHGKGRLTYKEPIDNINIIDGRWSRDKLVDGGEQLKIFSAEDITAHAMDHHSALLQDRLSSLPKANPEALELYSLVIAGYGTEEVFRRESRFLEDFFNTSLGVNSYEIYLVNSQRNLDQHPLATLTSISTALAHIAAKMNKDQDILLLYITSHGSKDKKISLHHNGLALADIESTWLASQLDATGIKHRVVILSACYSGGFIDDLKNDQTLVIASAAADKTSFGCADDSLFTYFGKAYFKESLKPDVGLDEAFKHARELVGKWEAEKKYTPSEPQIYPNERVSRQFRQWQGSQPVQVNQHLKP